MECRGGKARAEHGQETGQRARCGGAGRHRRITLTRTVNERSMLSSSRAKICEPLVTGVSPRPTDQRQRQKLRNTSYRVGAENWVTSCDLQVFVDEAAEPVPSEHANARPGTWRGVGGGWALVQGSVRAVGVEVLHILAQHDVE